MGAQINLRLPDKLFASTRRYSDEHGYGSIQEFIKEVLREKLFEEPDLTSEELKLVRELVEVTEKEDLYGTEKELFDKLK